MKKAVFATDAILCGVCIILDIIYMIVGGLWLKACTSITFVLIGLISLIYIIKAERKPYKAPIFLFIGVVLACIADVVINMSFLPGAGIFAAAHICYIICCSILVKFSVKDIIMTLVLFVPCCLLMLLLPFVVYDNEVMKTAALVYCFVLSLASGKAVVNYIKQRHSLNLSLAIGNVMFFISDIMLFFSVFSNRMVELFDNLCLSIYYPAQCVLAFSVFMFANKEKEQKI